MPDRMFTRFTIGQFAALHGINKKTLMWYDEVGLLHPVEIGENGYRYYNYYQSSTLETILQLRDLGVSIPDILDFMGNRSPAALQRMISEKINALDEQIKQLQILRTALAAKHKSLEHLQTIDLEQIELVQMPEIPLITITVDKHTPIETGVELVLRQARKHQLSRLYEGVYGSMIPVTHLMQGRFYDYTAMFMEMPQADDTKALHVRPGGLYLRAWCKGTWDQIPDRYRHLLSYIKQQGLEPYGCAYERGINERVIDTIDDYITQIDIPVKKYT